MARPFQDRDGAIQAHLAFLARRCGLRPAEAYRGPQRLSGVTKIKDPSSAMLVRRSAGAVDRFEDLEEVGGQGVGGDYGAGGAIGLDGAVTAGGADEPPD